MTDTEKVLSLVNECPGCTLIQIAAFTGLSKSGTSKALQRLRMDGKVELVNSLAKQQRWKPRLKNKL